MIDISHWKHLGYGGKSTLEKEELSSPSPEEKKYLIKYHRQFTQGISWEDITEYIAAKIGELLGLTMMEVDIVTRNGRRGCLLTNFIEAYDADMAEEGGSLLANSDAYLALQQSTKKNEALLEEGLAIIEKFPYWSIIKENFIETILFDILIGNQDRHTFNWMLLFKEHHVIFSPIYDNGASLGFRLDDKQLLDYLTNTHKMHKYVRQAKVKAGLFEKKSVKAKLVVTTFNARYPDSTARFFTKLQHIDMKAYHDFIEKTLLLSDAQKQWLHQIVGLRRDYMVAWREGDECI